MSIGFIIIAVIILSVVFAFVGMGIRIWFLNKRNKDLESENANLYESLRQKEKNLKILTNHYSAVQEITASNKKLKDKIKGAKNDKEVFNVINDIITANNKRMQND